MMKITWCGHSCFLLESEDGSAVFDPYSPNSVPGLEMPELSADVCLCSHEHGDHGYREGVRLSGKAPALTVETVDTFHDDKLGMLRGMNRIHTVIAEGMRVTHLGDLGHIPTEEQYELIGRPDVLLLPVGGFYTVDAAQAEKIAARLAPRIVVPMHYRGRGFGYDRIARVDDFLRRRRDVVKTEDSFFTVIKETPSMTLVMKCPII